MLWLDQNHAYNVLCLDSGREEVNKWPNAGLLASVLHSTDEDWLSHQRFFNPSFQNLTSLRLLIPIFPSPLNYQISRVSTTLACPRANFLLCTKVMLHFSHPPSPHTPLSILQRGPRPWARIGTERDWPAVKKQRKVVALIAMFQPWYTVQRTSTPA